MMTICFLFKTTKMPPPRRAASTTYNTWPASSQEQLKYKALKLTGLFVDL
jgi:hypothetical protein